VLEYKYYSIEKKEGLEYKRKRQQHFSSADTMVPVIKRSSNVLIKSNPGRVGGYKRIIHPMDDDD
jgi:hypothetical protein